MNNKLDNDFELALDDMDFDLVDEQQLMAATSSEISVGGEHPMEFLSDIPVQVSVEVGSKTVTLSELLTTQTESVLMLNKENGEPLDVKVNGKLFAYGEVVVSNGHYGVKITDIINKNIN